MQKPKSMVYVAGALTMADKELVEKLHELYDAMAEVISEYGFIPYVPHHNTDPLVFKDYTPANIDSITRLAVCNSRFVIAYVGMPSTGTGQEVEIAFHAGKQVFLVYEQEKMEKKLITRLVRGNPAIVREVPILNLDDINLISTTKVRLRTALESYLDEERKRNIPEILKP